MSLLLLGPALAPGYVLSYDMVWVPDLVLTPDAWGLGPGLPRAVPSDAVVGVLDEVIPGMLLQKLVLIGSLVVGGAGAARLVPEGGLPTRLVAVSFFLWNPFVVERLVMGHWTVLLGYALVPWLIRAAGAHRNGEPAGWWLWILLPLGSLSASAGLASGVVALAFGLGRSLRGVLALLAATFCANAPWLVAGLLHAEVSRSDSEGALVFALQGEGALPGPLAAFSLGGMWNAEVVPATREGPLAVVSLLVVVVLVAAGLPRWRQVVTGREQLGYVTAWAIGFGLAVVTWWNPPLIGWLSAEIPGGGLLRDGARLLGLCAPLLAVLTALGAARAGRVLGGRSHEAVVVGLLVLAPLALMPDAGWGSSGRLAAVSYPSSFERLRAEVGDADGGDVLLLPFSSYRAPAWNDGRKVLDPLGRYLNAQYVASDELIVSGRVIEGEDPRGSRVRQALAAATPDERASRLAALGISVVVVDLEAPGPSPEVAGTVLSSDGGYRAVRLSGADIRRPPAGWTAWMVAAWLGYLGAFVIGGVGIWRTTCGVSSRGSARGM